MLRHDPAVAPLGGAFFARLVRAADRGIRHWGRRLLEPSFRSGIATLLLPVPGDAGRVFGQQSLVDRGGQFLADGTVRRLCAVAARRLPALLPVVSADVAPPGLATAHVVGADL